MSACALALVLLLDASGSISDAQWAEQRDATAEAVESPAIVHLIQQQGAVALTAIAFDITARDLVGWRVLAGPAEARAFAAALRAAGRPLRGGTDLRAALLAGHAAHAEAPCAAERQVVDVSTDGIDHQPLVTAAARNVLAAEGVVVNVLAVGPEARPDWLREHVMTPGGFVIEARWQDYAAAIRRKLTWEVAGR